MKHFDVRDPHTLIMTILLALSAVFFATTAIVHLATPKTIQSDSEDLRRTLKEAMGDVDVYAGLSVPVRSEKRTARDEAKQCVALNAFYEARGEGWAGQVAVGQVAMRRAGLDYHHVCKEIYRPGQFSWTAERPRHGALPSGETWQWALAAAEQALVWAAHPEAHPDYSAKATYFHNTSVTPYWTRGLELVAMIGEHRFYR
jgi:spore germination cell wall hydrolase CwlJ-like protein